MDPTDTVLPDEATSAASAVVATTTTERPASRKRKAATVVAPQQESAQKKTRTDEADKLVLLYVNGLPTDEARQASALLVGFNGQQLAQALYDILYEDSSADELDEAEVKARIQGFLDSAIELDYSKKSTYVVTDGPPSMPSSPSHTEDAVSDARVRKRPLRVFVAKKFPSRSMYPEVAVLVDDSEKQALNALKLLTDGVIDNRPEDVKARGVDIREVSLSGPGSYRLSDGEFYEY
jgi:tellurite resistance protein